MTIPINSDIYATSVSTILNISAKYVYAAWIFFKKILPFAVLKCLIWKIR